MADRDLEAAIAATRFGLGARPGEIAAARSDPRGFLKAQIRREGADQPQPRADATQARIIAYRDLGRQRRQAKQAGDAEAADPVQQVQKLLRQETGGDFAARARLAALTEAGFRERWTLFWANHFTVSAAKAA
ncbi:MAG TPA: DUF1800 family protein, partial [Phenylobacterium sp.]|nr:DUF1800 family protein [Phenylobacterium sp.]